MFCSWYRQSKPQKGEDIKLEITVEEIISIDRGIKSDTIDIKSGIQNN